MKIGEMASVNRAIMTHNRSRSILFRFASGRLANKATNNTSAMSVIFLRR